MTQEARNVSRTLLVVCYARTLELAEPKRAWALDQIRAALPFGVPAMVVAATVTPRLGEALRSLARDRDIPLAEFGDDGVRRDGLKTRFWLPDGAPFEADHVRTAVLAAAVDVARRAAEAGCAVHLLTLGDPASAEMYTLMIRNLWHTDGENPLGAETACEYASARAAS